MNKLDLENWLELGIEPERGEGADEADIHDGEWYLFFVDAGGPWWDEAYLDSLCEDIDVMKEMEPELEEAFRRHGFCKVMVYGCGIVSEPWSCYDGSDIPEAHLEYEHIRTIPLKLG